MKRLTEYTIPETGFTVVPEEKYKRILMDEKPSVEKVYNRLKKIEDILGDEYDLDRLRELAEADREGRCVVLPCKLGDTVFKIGASICMWRETDHCDEYCNGYEYRDCWEGCRAVCEDKFSLDDLQRFGKNVFLTREAAEAALKAREQE